MSIYVVGDIHGCFDEWMQLKNKIESSDKNATFILVGDIIDRGPKTFEMLDWAMENITSDGKYQLILGNHEHEKIKWFNKVYTTLLQEYKDKEIVMYDYNDRYNFIYPHIKYNRVDKLEDEIRFFKSLPVIKDIEVNNKRFIIVHANLPNSVVSNDDKYTIQLDALTESQIEYAVWDRYLTDFDLIPNAILINGHTPTILYYEIGILIENKGKIDKMSHRYNIDCGLVYKESFPEANLAALNLDTLEEIYLYA